MTARSMHRTFAALFLPLVAFPLAAQSAPRDEPPNVILVFIDDMGWADLSCFGNRDASTPNIDRMATEGIRFGQFYVNAPICSPSRVAISTGQYPQRWRITSYLAHRKNNRARGMAQWLAPRAPMLARSLKARGYATGHFGKWHMGGQRDVAEAPAIASYGFDASLTNFEGMGPKLLPLTRKPGQEQPGRIWGDAERLGGPVTWRQRASITAGFVDAALAFIAKAKAERTPFYVNVWPDDVHSPFFPPVEKWGTNKRERYLAVLEEMDRQLAPLFDHVRDDAALRDNTLVMICSDNGHEPGAGQAGPLKGCKTNLYEGGIRSPLIVWGPGLVEAGAVGRRNDSSVFAAFDLVPSLLTLANATPDADAAYDGENVLDVLLGKSDDSRRTPLFFSRPPDRKSFYGFEDLPDLAVRDGRWKLLCDFDGGRPQLYDVIADPGESNDRSVQHPEVTRRLSTLLTTWHASFEDDGGTHLVLDARVIQRTDGVKLTVGTVAKHPANPLFAEELPWEVRFDNVYANVLFDRQEQLYKCWYSPFVIDADEPADGRAPGTYMQMLRATKRPRTMGICYATSKDGVQWSKPRLDVRRWDDGQETNLVDIGPHGAGIFKDLREPDPARRYKMFMKERGVAVEFSPDGLHWSEPVRCAEVEAAADTHNNALWVPELKQYVGFTRLWGGEPRQRIVGRCESPDFVRWTKAEPVLAGAVERQTYAMPVFRYRDVFLGLVVVFQPSIDRSHTELAWSPDTVAWHRIDPGTPLIPTAAEPGAYDWGCVYAAAHPVVLDDEIRLYYGASDGPHTDWRKGFLALATLRPDGFAGYEPVDADRPGTVVTQPVRCAGGDIRITADAAAGSIRVSVLDDDGDPIAVSEPVTADVTDHPVGFADGFRPPTRPIRLRFELKSAKLYSFR